MPQAASSWTAELVRALPDDGKRYEVVDGELLVTPAPSWNHQRALVPEYWAVDLDARLVERWTPSDERPEVLSETLAWRPDPVREPLVLDLPRVFREAWGE